MDYIGKDSWGKNNPVPGLEKFRVGVWMCQLAEGAVTETEGSRENLTAIVCFDMLNPVRSQTQLLFLGLRPNRNGSKM